VFRRACGVVIGVIATIAVAGAAVLTWPTEAGARRAQPAEAVSGRVVNERLEQGRTVREPIEGVHITVTGANDETAGEAVTDAEGNYTIPLPGPGDYVLQVDKSSVPDGVQVSDADASRPVSIRPDQTLVGNFFLGGDTRKTESRLSRLPQTVADGLVFGLIIAVCSIGLSLIYGTTGLSNFAHGEIVTFGAIITWYLNQRAGWTLLVAALFGIGASMLFGALFELGLWRPLRLRKTSLTSMMIVSIGLAIFFRYLWNYIYGGRSRPYGQFQQQTQIDFGLFDLTPRSVFTIILCVVVLVGVAMFLLRTRFGKAIRAVSDNPDLASATGINTDRVLLIVWAMGGALAGLGGVLLGLDQQVRWDSGATLLLLMFAAITLGGLGNAFGALVGSLVIGMAVELWTWFFPSFVDIKRVGALALLILLLLARPQGLLGRAERVG